MNSFWSPLFPSLASLHPSLWWLLSHSIQTYRQWTKITLQMYWFLFPFTNKGFQIAAVCKPRACPSTVHMLIFPLSPHCPLIHSEAFNWKKEKKKTKMPIKSFLKLFFLSLACFSYFKFCRQKYFLALFFYFFASILFSCTNFTFLH